MRYVSFATLVLVSFASIWGCHHSPSITRLTMTNARNGQPFCSPDGEHVSFVSNRSGSWQAWIMTVDGREQRQLTDHPDPVGWPSWSANGGRIAFYAGSDGNYRLFSTDLERGEPMILAEIAFPSFRPTLSSNGRRILFDGIPDASTPNHEIFELIKLTGTLRQLTMDDGYDSDARWSPDEHLIAFHSDRDGDEQYDMQIYVMNSDGTGLRQLTEGPSVNRYPSWSPRGDRIVYVSELDGNRDIWIMNVDGSERVRLTKYPGFDSDPVWCLSANRIIFSTDRFDGSQELAALTLE